MLTFAHVLFIILLVVGTTLVASAWVKSSLNCPPPKIIYRFVPKHPIDIAFNDESNKPSVLYKNMF